VADFGLAEWLQHDGKTEVQLVTNRCWVAPEVLQHQFGPFTISRASEVYMFGMLMYEALTGRIPYWEELLDLPPRDQQVVCTYQYQYQHKLLQLDDDAGLAGLHVLALSDKSCKLQMDALATALIYWPLHARLSTC
jgi:serine/threonine protein kinase